jgi:hypothetical protein
MNTGKSAAIWKLISKNSHWCWLALGAASLLAGQWLPASLVEQYYSRGFYQLIRSGLSLLSSWLPFAAVYVLLALLSVRAMVPVLHFIRLPSGRRHWLKAAFFTFLSFVGGLIFLFQVMWGFNYFREPLEERLGIEPLPLDEPELQHEFERSTEELLQLRAQLPVGGDDPVPEELLPAALERTLREDLRKVLLRHGYPAPEGIRGRQLWPPGLLLRISTAGIYLPFTGEGHADMGLHHLQLPFVLTHEMSHAYGFGDEGTCNFLAWLASRQSDNPYLRYAGQLYYWRYLAGAMKSGHPELDLSRLLPAGIRADLASIRHQMDKYPDVFSGLRDAIYEAYLRLQGIEEGMKNYDRVIVLVHAWREKTGSY